MRTYTILTIFPHILDSYLNESILKRAITKKLLKVVTVDIRDFATNKHNSVDDTPYGGGPGMVMMIEPIFKALKKHKLFPSKKTSRIILLSPRGKKFNKTEAKRLAKFNSITFIAGRYEAIDERVADHMVDEVISIGDYTLSGGELPSLVVIEAISRFIPGVVGKMESVTKDDTPQYTKPESFSPKKGSRWNIPSVLLSGNHVKIRTWRNSQKNKNV
jgi:tRNA (guanine37-N1)-methyltransferase